MKPCKSWKVNWQAQPAISQETKVLKGREEEEETHRPELALLLRFTTCSVEVPQIDNTTEERLPHNIGMNMKGMKKTDTEDREGTRTKTLAIEMNILTRMRSPRTLRKHEFEWLRKET